MPWIKPQKGWLGDVKPAGTEVPDVVEYPKLKCPRCSSKNVVITRTDKPNRYHKCRQCGFNFRSVEE